MHLDLFIGKFQVILFLIDLPESIFSTQTFHWFSPMKSNWKRTKSTTTVWYFGDLFWDSWLCKFCKPSNRWIFVYRILLAAEASWSRCPAFLRRPAFLHWPEDASALSPMVSTHPRCSWICYGAHVTIKCKTFALQTNSGFDQAFKHIEIRKPLTVGK